MASSPAIPENRNAITAEWLWQALTAGGASGLPTIENVVVEDIGAGVGILAEILRCHLTYRDEARAAPETVIVKLPSTHRKTLRMGKWQRLYKREYAYYRHLSRQSPLRSPRLLYGDFEASSHRFVLVLEDLRGMDVFDEIEGAGAENAKRAIRAVAKLHGHYWNKVDRPPLSGLHDIFAAKYRPLLQVVYLASLVPTLNRFGDAFSVDMRRLAEAYGPRVADHIGEAAAGTKTFVHGDFRLDNMFFGPGPGEDLTLVDWQISGLACGLWDVAFLLGSSVSIEVRRQIERESLEEYHDILCSMGVSDFTFEECWRLYREYVLGRLVVAVFLCGGVDLPFDRSRRLAEVSLRRTLAAIEDLDAAEFLPDRRRFFSLANAFSTFSHGAYKAYKAVR
ncbi:MAG: phosphotransferase [Chloroflexi bacterium]|nr:phosphotransferase [Chloroflexota bacterium]